MENNSLEKNGGFVVNVNSPGNMIAGSITLNGPVNMGCGVDSSHGKNGYTDEQIARAIESICGDGKALDAKWKWAGVYWCLRWYCNFPVKGMEFCDRIASLPFSGPLSPECDYNNIRRIVVLSFMNQDARELSSVKPSKSDEDICSQCRTIVVDLAEELGKTMLPKL